MPTLQFTDPVQKISVTKNFPTPTKVTDVWKGWYKTCKKLVPQIPDIPETIGYEAARWHCEPPEIDVKWIKFTLVYVLTGEKAYLVINRKGPSM